jgi:hypothetical protein
MKLLTKTQAIALETHRLQVSGFRHETIKASIKQDFRVIVRLGPPPDRTKGIEGFPYWNLLWISFSKKTS